MGFGNLSVPISLLTPQGGVVEHLISSTEPEFPALQGSVKKVPFGWFGAFQTEMKTIWWAVDRRYVYYSNFACGLQKHE